MEYKDILFSVKDQTGIITLNRPDKINALSINMIKEINAALLSAADDENLKVIIIRGNGKHFCAGHDLSEMVGKEAKDYRYLFGNMVKLMRTFHEIPLIVITQVHGIATAAGCQLVAWSDLAVAADNAKFGTPGVKIGLFCTTPMTAITRAIGRKAAMEMLITGRMFDANEAKTLGLLNKVVPENDLTKETEDMASQISEASRFVLEMGKQAFYVQTDMPDYSAFEYTKHTIALNGMSKDAQIGISSFINKSKPKWENR